MVFVYWYHSCVLMLFSSKVHMPGPQEFIINYRDCSHCVKFSGCRRSNICCTLFSRSIAMCPFQVTANCIKILTGTSYLIGMASHYLLFRVINVRSFGVLCIKVFIWSLETGNYPRIHRTLWCILGQHFFCWSFKNSQCRAPRESLISTLNWIMPYHN